MLTIKFPYEIRDGAKEIGVEFSYQDLERFPGRKSKATTCTIFLIRAGVPYILGEAQVNCDTRERFEKEKGRKHSLALVLGAVRINRYDRFAIWDSYFKRGARTDPRDPKFMGRRWKSHPNPTVF